MNLFSDLFAFIKDAEIEDPYQLKIIEDNSGSAEGKEETDKVQCDKIGRSRKRNEGKYACDKCEYKSELKQNIKRHTESQHLGILKFFCKSCNYKSYFSSHIRVHMKLKHKIENGKICRIGCKKCAEGEEHNICDKIEGKFACDKCEYKSDLERNIQSHNESKHLRILKFFCKSCNYKCYFFTSMRNHMKSKHKIDNGKICRIGCNKCAADEEHNKCDKIARQKTNIEGKYACNECEYKSDVKQDMKTHTESKHLGTLKFFCKSCNYKCYFLPSMRSHMKLKHKIENLIL